MIPLSIRVENVGRDPSESTTLRYHQSTDAIIDADDTELGMAMVATLAGESMSEYSMDITTPMVLGDYYYGACVETVTGEIVTNNNCSSAKRLHVYTPLQASERIEFNSLDGDNVNLRGIWSDGTILWIVNSEVGIDDDDKLFAYNLSDGCRNAAKDFNMLRASGNYTPSGIWSDGITMWIADWESDKVYAHEFPVQLQAQTLSFSLPKTEYTTGETDVVLTATSTSNLTEFTFSSSDETVATISGNMLTFLINWNGHHHRHPSRR